MSGCSPEMGKAVYEKRKREHVCARCGKADEQTLSGRVYCAECAEKYNQRTRERRDRRIAEGVCIRCGESDERTAEGHTECKVCFKAQRYARLDRYQAKLENRRCVKCNKPLPDEWHYVCCPTCRERQNKVSLEYYHRRKSDGV